MSRNSVPAIRRDFNQSDRAAHVFQTMKDTVTFKRGFGDSGKKYQIVEKDCPACYMTQLFRTVRVNPEFGRSAEYYCLNINCPHYHNGDFDFARCTLNATEPSIDE